MITQQEDLVMTKVNRTSLKPGMQLRHLHSDNIATVVADKNRPKRLRRAHQDFVIVTRRQPSGKRWTGTWSLYRVEIV